ncbi:MAG: ribosomal protein [Actinomycetota bacterium]
MGARSNKTLREKAKQSKSAAAAAAMKKFKKKPCSFCRDNILITKILPPFANTLLIEARFALDVLLGHAPNTNEQ